MEEHKDRPLVSTSTNSPTIEYSSVDDVEILQSNGTLESSVKQDDVSCSSELVQSHELTGLEQVLTNDNSLISLNEDEMGTWRECEKTEDGKNKVVIVNGNERLYRDEYEDSDEVAVLTPTKMQYNDTINDKTNNVIPNEFDCKQQLTDMNSSFGKILKLTQLVEATGFEKEMEESICWRENGEEVESTLNRVRKEEVDLIVENNEDHVIERKKPVEEVSLPCVVEKDNNEIETLTKEKEKITSIQKVQSSEEIRQTLVCEYQNKLKIEKKENKEMEAQLTEEPASYRNALYDIQQEVGSTLAFQVTRYAVAITNERAKHENNLEYIKANYAETLHKIQCCHEQEINEMKERFELKIENLMISHKKELVDLRNEHSQHASILRDEIVDNQYEKMETAVRAELSRATQEMELKLREMEEEEMEREKRCQEALDKNIILEDKLTTKEKELDSLQHKLASVTKTLQQMQAEVEKVIEHNHLLLKQQQDMEEQNAQLVVEINDEKTRNEQLKSEGNILTDENEEIKKELHHIQDITDQKHQEDTITLDLMNKQLQDLQDERDSLHYALDTIRSSVASLLPLTPTIEAVLPPPHHPHSPPLIPSEGVQIHHPIFYESDDQTHSNQPVIQNHWSSPLPLNNLTTPNDKTQVPIVIGSTGDSGLVSQQTSAGHNTGIGPEIGGTLYDGSVIRTLRPGSRTTIIPPVDISISQTKEKEFQTPLPSILHSQTNQQQDLTILSLNASMTEPPSNTHQSSLPVTMTPDISIVHVDQSEPPIVIPLDMPQTAGIIAEAQNVQVMVSHLHQSIAALLKNYVSTSSQTSEYYQRLGTSQDELIQSQSGIANQLKLIEQLQHQLKNLESQLTDQSMEYQMCNDELRDKKQELDDANNKISSLVQQVESLANKEYNEETTDQMSLLKQELISCEQELISQRNLSQDLQHKKELLEMDLREQIENHANEKKVFEKDLQDKERQINEFQNLHHQLAMKEKIEEKLRDEVKELNDELMSTQHELAMLQSHNNPEYITDLQSKVSLLEKQLSQQKQVNRDIQAQFESAVNSLNSVRNEALEIQLHQQIDNLQDLLQQKDSSLQDMIADKSRFENQCVTLQEQVTTLGNQVDLLHDSMKVSNEKVSELCEHVEKKEREIQRVTQENSTFNEHVIQLQIESKRHLQAYEQAVVQTQALQDEIKETQQLLNTREKEIESLTVCRGQLDDKIVSMNTEMKEKEEYHEIQTRSLQHNLEQIQSNLREKDTEIELLKHHEDSTAEKELQELKIQIQKCISLTEHENELSAMITKHNNEMTELETRLKAEHLGQISMMKLQYSEQLNQIRVKDELTSVVISSSDENLLQKIAELAPLLEKDSQDIRELCQETKHEDIMSILTQKEKEIQDLQTVYTDTAKEVVTLTADNHRLQQELSGANETLTTLEESMQQANTIITELKKELKSLSVLNTEIRNEISERKIEFEGTLEEIEKKARQEKENNELLVVKLKDIEQFRITVEDQNRRLQNSLCVAQEELVKANREAKQANSALEDNIRKAKRLNIERKDHDTEENIKLQDSLEHERERVRKLTASLQTKEEELTRTVDQYLQEKVLSAKTRGENSALHSRIQSLVNEIDILQTQVNGDDVISGLYEDKLKLQSDLERLQVCIEQQKNDRLYSDEKTKSLENQVADLRQTVNNISEQCVKYKSSRDEMESKCTHSLSKMRRKCKALVFQKKYLMSEIDAFYHTQQGALMMIDDMGAPITYKRAKDGSYMRFKIVALMVQASVRIKRLYHRRRLMYSPHIRGIPNTHTSSHVPLSPLNTNLSAPQLPTKLKKSTSPHKSRSSPFTKHHSSKYKETPITTTTSCIPVAAPIYHTLPTPMPSLTSPLTPVVSSGSAAIQSTDPQVTEYLKELEKLQERLNRSKPHPLIK